MKYEVSSKRTMKVDNRVVLEDIVMTEEQLAEFILNHNGGGQTEEQTARTMEHIDQLKNGNSVTFEHPSMTAVVEVEIVE